MTTRDEMRAWAKKVAGQQQFDLGELLYEGTYYDEDHVRNGVWDGSYQGKQAVLKVYQDPRLSDEPTSLQKFHEYNTSTKLTAPQVYASEVVTPHKGWMILEKLPDSGSFFKSPLSAEDRAQFLRAYLEYRRNFPTKPWREMTLVESLPSDKRYLFSINRWLELANNKESERRLQNQALLLPPDEFIPRYTKVLAAIAEEMGQRKTIWCHGHFKPKELYRAPNGMIYLTDFAHTTVCPEGYEFGFMIWSDWFMDGGDWRLDYAGWKKGIDAWLNDLRPIVDQLKIERPDDLLRVSLLERTIGAILADVTAADRPREEAEKRNTLFFQLIDDLL